MKLRIEKTRPKVDAQEITIDPEVQKPREITARMHFYAVHNSGEQLRRASTVRTGKRPDRMEGR
jgi:hypothetical protein